MRFQTQVNFVPEYVTAGPRKADLMAVADHIDHIASVIGRKQCVSLPFTLTPLRLELSVPSMGDSVGLGSDYDGMETTTDGLEDVATFPALVRSLVRSCYLILLWC